MMEKVRIPTKVLLDVMMQQLGLPNAVYSTHKARTVGLEATVQFYPSEYQLNNGFAKKSISIYVYGKLEEAEDRLANEALKYMEASYNKVLQDFNYDKLLLVQQKNKSLDHELKEKEGIIDYLSCIINTNFIARSTPEDNNLNHILSQIKYVADHLDDTILQWEDILQKTNKYYWGLDDDMEGISTFANDSPPNTPTTKSCLDDEVIFDTDGIGSDDST